MPHGVTHSRGCGYAVPLKNMDCLAIFFFYVTNSAKEIFKDRYFALFSLKNMYNCADQITQ